MSLVACTSGSETRSKAEKQREAERPSVEQPPPDTTRGVSVEGRDRTETRVRPQKLYGVAPSSEPL